MAINDCPERWPTHYDYRHHTSLQYINLQPLPRRRYIALSAQPHKRAGALSSITTTHRLAWRCNRVKSWSSTLSKSRPRSQVLIACPGLGGARRPPAARKPLPLFDCGCGGRRRLRFSALKDGARLINHYYIIPRKGWACRCR